MSWILEGCANFGAVCDGHRVCAKPTTKKQIKFVGKKVIGQQLKRQSTCDTLLDGQSRSMASQRNTNTHICCALIRRLFFAPLCRRKVFVPSACHARVCLCWRIHTSVCNYVTKLQTPQWIIFLFPLNSSALLVSRPALEPWWRRRWLLTSVAYSVLSS